MTPIEESSTHVLDANRFDLFPPAELDTRPLAKNLTKRAGCHLSVGLLGPCVRLTQVIQTSQPWHHPRSSSHIAKEQKAQVFADLQELFDSELLTSLTCGFENCINNLNLPGLEDMGSPRAVISQGFDCGLHCVAKDVESFRKWWGSDEHAQFMKKHPDFASVKINLEWMHEK